MRLTAKGPNGTSLKVANFTVIVVTISSRTGSGTLSADNSAGATYFDLLGTASLATFHSVGAANSEWRNGMEIIGTVAPSNFAETVILYRSIDDAYLYVGSTLGGCKSTTIPQCSISPDDTNGGAIRDDDPQSGGSCGKVYDLDASGIASKPANSVGNILRRRTNFHQWSTVDDGMRVSTDYIWYAWVSILKTATGDVLSATVINNNVAGSGVTNLTWDLQ